mmetsp:Transcript_64385/g.107013  ORF Transcript_64385/g.107013 Transcript_64385/m.107013 type:complete len:231 (-) Transcript_64385:2-694(-)
MQVCFLLLAAAVAEGFLPAVLRSQQVGNHARAAALQMIGKQALEKKTKVVEGVKEVMAESQLMFCVRSEGLQVNELNAFRQTLPEGVVMQCVKNTLIKRAVQDFPHFQADGLESVLHYSNFWFFAPEEQIRPAVEKWEEFQKGTKKDGLDIVGGVFDGQFLDAKGVEAVSKLPTKQELMGQTATLLTALPAKLARSVKAAGAERLARGVQEARGAKMAPAGKLASEKMSP